MFHKTTGIKVQKYNLGHYYKIISVLLFSLEELASTTAHPYQNTLTKEFTSEFH